MDDNASLLLGHNVSVPLTSRSLSNVLAHRENHPTQMCQPIQNGRPMKLSRKLLLVFAAVNIISIAKAEQPCSRTTAFVGYGPGGSVKNLDTIQLTPGHWDCSVTAEAKTSGSISAMMVSLGNNISTISGGGIPYVATSGANGGPGYGLSVSTPLIRVDVATTTNYYLNALVYQSASAATQLRSFYQCTAITITN